MSGETLTTAARAALDDFDALVAESYGVCGLHMNGDVAPWQDLCAGGHFEMWTAGIERLRDALHLEVSK